MRNSSPPETTVVSRKSDDELVRQVTYQVEVAIAQNRRLEWLLIGLLVAQFAVGLGLLIYGAVVGAWQLLAPGGLMHVALVWPVQKLIRVRSENRTLLILPRLMQLADSAEAQRLAAQLVLKLIEKV